MPVSLCPDRTMLLNYRLGELSETDAAPITEHISTCADCQAALGTFSDAEDTLLSRLRQPAEADPYSNEPEEAQFLARAMEMVAAGGQTPAQPDSVEPSDLGQLGEYELLAKLGEGGMGAVYKARQTRLKKIVALKVLPKEHTSDPQAVARFEREMEAVGRVSHPNIVQAHDARDIDGTTVLVMEYVEGQDLSHVVKRLGMLPIADACEIARQTALGLQAAHDHGLVHRDIKPSNLMLPSPLALRERGRQISPRPYSGEGQGVRAFGLGPAIIKILDLGLARLGTEKPGDAELTSSGAAMGTADYMAPEQAADAHTADARADIYSLGCTLYKLLSGHAPFSGPNHPTQMKKMMAHLAEPVPPIRGLRADVPEALAAVIDRMLAKKPEDRIATAAEVAAALAPFAAGADLNRLAAAAAGNAEALASSQVLTEPFMPSAMSNTTPSHAVGAVAGECLPSPSGRGAGESLPSPVLGRGAGGEGSWGRFPRPSPSVSPAWPPPSSSPSQSSFIIATRKATSERSRRPTIAQLRLSTSRRMRRLRAPPRSRHTPLLALRAPMERTSSFHPSRWRSSQGSRSAKWPWSPARPHWQGLARGPSRPSALGAR